MYASSDKMMQVPPLPLNRVREFFNRIISFGELYNYGQTARGNFPSPPPNQRAVSMTVGPVQQMVWRGTRRARESPIRPPPPPPPPQHQAEAP